MEYDLFTLKKNIAKEMTEKRFYHTLAVESVSFSLAIRYNYDTDKATLAGLLHDCVKCLPDEEMLMQCEKYNLPISDVERRNAYLLHGKLGAYYAMQKYGILDEDILSAITYHTTGKENMNLLEKIVFTADYIEPNRSKKRIPDLDNIRKLAFSDIDKAVYQILANTLNYLDSGTGEIDQLTVKAYEYYKKKLNLKGEYNEEL